MKTPHRLASNLATVFVLLLTAACASLGLAPAESFGEKTAYAFGNITAVREAAAAALRSGGISVSTARDVQVKADQAAAALNLATHLNATGSSQEANSRLLIALTLISEIQALMNMEARKP